MRYVYHSVIFYNLFDFGLLVCFLFRVWKVSLFFLLCGLLISALILLNEQTSYTIFFDSKNLCQELALALIFESLFGCVPVLVCFASCFSALMQLYRFGCYNTLMAGVHRVFN